MTSQDEHEKLIQACYERWLNDRATWTQLYELMTRSLQAAQRGKP